MKQKRLLIVDDEPEIREILAEKVANIDAEVTLAADGREALSILKNQTFEAVLSDLSMPYMTGIELLRSLRESGNMVPFVILTAFGQKSTVVSALNLGAFDFIDKPSEDAQLFSVLNAALELGAELNFWKQEEGITDSLIQVGTENSNKAASEINKKVPAEGDKYFPKPKK